VNLTPIAIKLELGVAGNGRFPKRSGIGRVLSAATTKPTNHSASGLSTLDSGCNALGVVAFLVFDHSIVAVRSRLDRVLAFWCAASLVALAPGAKLGVSIKPRAVFPFEARALRMPHSFIIRQLASVIFV
jgi:hypothetical protein